jgi:hypothetical protein
MGGSALIDSDGLKTCMNETLGPPGNRLRCAINPKPKISYPELPHPDDDSNAAFILHYVAVSNQRSAFSPAGENWQLVADR